MEKIINRKQTIKSSSFFKKLVIKYLKQYDNGFLEMKTDNGATLSFGDPNSETRASIVINDSSFFKKVFMSGDIGFAESYMDGDWSSPDLKSLFLWAISNIENSGIISGSKKRNYQINILSFLNKVIHGFNANTIDGSKKNISYHYDLSNKFYELMLDPTMTYSCAVFKGTTDLEQAQLKKYELITKALNIKNGDRILEIGFGWGGFANYLNDNFNNCEYLGVTISREQFEFAKSKINSEKTKENVINFEFMDYRNIKGNFDKVVSIEMIEAVGHDNYPEYFNKISNLLEKDGVATIQAITSPDSRYEQIRKGSDFIQKHIFPGSLLPSIRAITNACTENELHIFEIKDIGIHYANTLNHWYNRFTNNWNKTEELGFNQTFKRKWSYYLKYCEAAFQTRNISTQQITFIKPNNTTHALTEA